MMCHITISTPSEPASRMYSVWVDARQGKRIFGHAIQKGLVEFSIDQAGALALQLMRHAAGAVNDDAQILLETLDRTGDGLPEFEAAHAGGRRILHDIDAQGDDGKGPLRRLAAGNGQGYGETVIHRHFIRDGHVELVQDQGFGQMPGECRMTLYDGHRARPKTFVRDREAISHSDEKCGNDLQREGAMHDRCRQ